ncbi:MAG TPA: DUF421 domain-containing protein [Oscillospiraceae bacterium]|nr:DUF421 domain-containing protein [Oscillospiraceae bacterium]
MIIAFFRTVILYTLLIIGIRLMGKRQVGELEPTELVLALIIADLASVPMQNFGTPLFNGIIPIVTLLALTTAMSVLTMKSIRLRALLCSKPAMIVEHGKLCQDAMRRTRLTIDELLEELRMQNVTDISTVEYAVLETNGRISVLLYPEHQSVTAGQMQVSTQPLWYPLVVVSDGRLMRENLTRLGFTEDWVRAQLLQRGIQKVEDVFILLADRTEKIYFLGKEAAG